MNSVFAVGFFAAIVWLMAVVHGGWRVAFGAPIDWRPGWRGALRPMLLGAVCSAGIWLTSPGEHRSTLGLIAGALLVAAIATAALALSGVMMIAVAGWWHDRAVKEQRAYSRQGE